MKEIGIVNKIDKDGAVVEIMPEESCSKCCSCGAAKKREIRLTGVSAQGLKQGDKVSIEINSSIMMKLYLLLYGLPLIIFVVSLLFFYKISSSPVISFLGAAFLTVICLALIFSRKYSRTSKGVICKKE